MPASMLDGAPAIAARGARARALAGAHLPTSLATGALVLEDVAAGSLDERALFHLLNLARQEQAFVLITARAPPVRRSARRCRANVTAPV